MAELPLKALLALVALDQKIYETEQSVHERQKERAQADEQERHIIAELEQAKKAMQTARKEVDFCELEIKELTGKEKAKRSHLNETSKYKELQSLNTEIEHLNQRQQTVEDQLLHAWNTLDNKQKQYEMEQKLFDNRLQELQQLKEKKESEINALKNTIHQLQQERISSTQAIPEEWLEKYTAMRTKVKDPIVPLISDACGGCFYQIPNQEIIRLKRGALLQCKQCFRLIYMAESS